MKKLKTINLKGKEYVQVNSRVEYFNETYQLGKIETSYDKQGQEFVFKAIVTPDVERPERFFTGHSFGEVGKEKAIEKLETVAVGRALALMGIGIVEGLASAEEMDKFNASAANKYPSTHPKPRTTSASKPYSSGYTEGVKKQLQFTHAKGCKSKMFQLPDGSWACENDECNKLNK